MTENKMVGWHHRLDGHEFKQAPGVGGGQGSLVCCSPWGHKEKDKCYDIMYKWNLKYDADEFTCKSDSDTENRLVVAKGNGPWRRS